MTKALTHRPRKRKKKTTAAPLAHAIAGFGIGLIMDAIEAVTTPAERAADVAELEADDRRELIDIIVRELKRPAGTLQKSAQDAADEILKRYILMPRPGKKAHR